MMEVHDCFSITELTVYEDLLISPGEIIDDILDGSSTPGEGSCQPDGGLKCFGIPSGLRAANALRDVQPAPGEMAGREKGEEPRFGLTHNLGGIPSTNVCSVAIIGGKGDFTAERAENAEEEKIKRIKY